MKAVWVSQDLVILVRFHACVKLLKGEPNPRASGTSARSTPSSSCRETECILLIRSQNRGRAEFSV